MANTPVIIFDQVSKRFVIHRDGGDTIQERFASMLRPRARGEEFWALRDVSFRVAKGESLGLVGHNGAGKSTALKLMTRILEPTSGRVELNGRVAALLELGSGFHPDLSGRENVFLNGSLLGFGRREMQAKLPEIIDFAEIGDFIDMEVKHYSSGMYTRLAFAVATAVDPDILITDEVLAVGDEAFQRKCMDRIYRFRQLGKTIIFVSHALATVRTLCDHAVWLDHGEARLSGPAGEVIDAYLAEVNRREQAQLAQRPGAADSAGGQRHGTREIEITQVELLDADGQAQNVFQTHASLTVRMHYSAHQPISQPVFGVGLHHESGFWINGPNTRFDNIDIAAVDGAGYVDYHIPSLPLLGGRYQISVAVVDSTMLHTYDQHDRMYRLVVQSAGLREQYGMLAIAAEWDLAAGFMTPTISIIIITYNSAGQIGTCLRALQQLRSDAEYEIVVVDNASHDESRTIVGGFPSVRLIAQSENWGFGGGINRGVAAARGRIIALLNPDAIPAPSWLEQLVAPFNDPRVGVVGSKVLGPAGLIQSVGSTLQTPVMLSAHCGDGERDAGQYDAITDVWAVHGAAMAFARPTWDTLGGFDEGYFPAYWEESDFCERVRRAGQRVIVAPQAVVRHHEASATGKYSAEFYFYYHRNRLRYAAKWLDWPTLWEQFRLAEHTRLATAPPLDRRVARLVYTAGVPPISPPDAEQRATIRATGQALRAGTLPDDGLAPLLRLLDDADANAIHQEVAFQSRLPLVARLRTAWNNLATRWYVRPNFDQQTRFNLAAQRALIALADQSTARAAADALDVALLVWRLNTTR